MAGHGIVARKIEPWRASVTQDAEKKKFWQPHWKESRSCIQSDEVKTASKSHRPPFGHRHPPTSKVQGTLMGSWYRRKCPRDRYIQLVIVRDRSRRVAKLR